MGNLNSACNVFGQRLCMHIKRQPDWESCHFVKNVSVVLFFKSRIFRTADKEFQSKSRLRMILE